MPQKLFNIGSFRDRCLADFFSYAAPHKSISGEIHAGLARKLDIINAATCWQDLKSPPGNRYERLQGKLKGYSSIRVNKQYRLIFKWTNGRHTIFTSIPMNIKE